jgi:uncharacterized protein
MLPKRGNRSRAAASPQPGSSFAFLGHSELAALTRRGGGLGSWSAREGSRSVKKILSIDGGGIRGLIPALVLAELEARTNKPVAESFDLIAGTSTGGILALALARSNGAGKPRYTARDVASLYRTRGKDIFKRSLWSGVSSASGLLDQLYPNSGIEGVLQEYFGEEQLGAGLVKTLITTYDIENREPLFLKSWRHDFASVLMRDAARATSAAPTYFEPALIQVGTSVRALIDGGVFINSPSVSAYAEARKVFPEERDFLVVSLGTGELIRPIPHDEAKDWGKVGWLLPLISCVFDGVGDAADYQMATLLGDRYLRFQTRLTTASDDLDNATNSNLDHLALEANNLIEAQLPQLNQLVELIG